MGPRGNEHRGRLRAAGAARPMIGRTVWIAGAVPALVYGTVIDGLLGATVGLLVWTVACAAAVGIRRHRTRARRIPPPESRLSSQSTQNTPAEPDPFEQLQRTPCGVCGAPTLLQVCLDCTEGPTRQQRPHRDDRFLRDEPDDPVG